MPSIISEAHKMRCIMSKGKTYSGALWVQHAAEKIRRIRKQNTIGALRQLGVIPVMRIVRSDAPEHVRGTFNLCIKV